MSMHTPPVHLLMILMTPLLLGAPARAGQAGRSTPSLKPPPSGRGSPEPIQELLQTTGLPSSEEVRRSFDRAQVTPFDNPQLAFAVLVPKDWQGRRVTATPRQLAEDRLAPVPLAELGPKTDRGVVLQVLYMRVPPDVTLPRFLLLYAERSGLKLLGRQRGTFNGRTVEEALLRASSPELGPHLIRLAVLRHGDLVFMISCSAREAAFPKWKRIFATAVVSFEPTGT
jgi:hypothetical protein